MTMAQDAAPTALAELRQWPHWVVWRQETRDGKTTKVPCVATSPRRHASSTDPDTWGPYEAAAQTVQRGGAAGVGYVFTPHDEYTGVDLDKCVTDGQVVPEAMSIVQRLDSYTELSPTGTGLHVFVRGRINGDRNRTSKTPWGGEFESYDQGRFFTVTEQHLPGTPTTIEARQDELDAVRAELFPAAAERPPPSVVGTGIDDDVELLERAGKAKNGRDFEALYSGDLGRHGDDESAADLALCNMLAFWAGPHPERIDSLFRRSGLMREKWDSPRGTTTYGRITVDKALEGRAEFYNQPNGTQPAAGVKRPADDDVEMSPGEEMSHICGLIGDPFAHGWRPSRQAKSRVVLTTGSGRVLDLESWKATTTTPRTLAQEIRLQMGVDVTLTKEGLNRLDVLVGKFCELVEATAIRDRAWQIGMEFLQEAEQVPVDMADKTSRFAAFQKLQANRPAVRAKAENISYAEACMVLVDVSGKRYVRVQWFVDYVKASAVSGTTTAILEHMEAPGWWAKPNSQGRYFAPDPAGGKRASQILYEVPSDWEEGGS